MTGRRPGRVRDRGGDAGDQLAARIKAAAAADGRNTYQLAQAAGLDAAVVQRFLAGTRPDLRLSTASRLCAALGLRLIDTRAGRGR